MPEPNHEVVKRGLEQVRADLLDLGLRNRFLNYRPSATRGVEIVCEEPARVFDVLVRQDRKMAFAGKPGLATQTVGLPGDENSSVVSESAESADDVLHTDEPEAKLSNRLLKTFRDHRSSIEEQGVNILFLTLGMLEWFDVEYSSEVIRSPLILIPVTIERSQGDHFKIQYDDSEVTDNLSLKEKLRRELGITLPVLEDEETLDVNAYFDGVKQAIARQTRWQVDVTRIVLGFFNYTKFLIYKDLDGSAWPAAGKPWMHQELGKLLDLECGFVDEEPGVGDDENVDNVLRNQSTNEVCLADPSQMLAILQAKTGNTMVIQGPPGTGKSQTITNLIAEMVAEGKTVLFVSEKRAALDVVQRNLERVGLKDICVELHSRKANKREFYEELKRTVDLGRPNHPILQARLRELDETRDKLNAYCEATHALLPGRAISPIQVIGRLLGLPPAGVDEPNVDFSLMQPWSQSDFDSRRNLVVRLQDHVHETGVPRRNPFWGSQLRLVMPEDLSGIVRLANQAISQLTVTLDSAHALAGRMQLPVAKNATELECICRAARRAASSPDLTGLAVSSDGWLQENADIAAVITSGKDYARIRSEFSSLLTPAAWDEDVAELRRSIAEYGPKWWRWLSKRYWVARRQLRRLCATKLPKSQQERLALLDAITLSQSRRAEIDCRDAALRSMFGPKWKGRDSDWESLERAFLWVTEVHRDILKRYLPVGILHFVETSSDLDGLEKQADAVEQAGKEYTARVKSLLDRLEAGPQLRNILSLDYTCQSEKFGAWLSNPAPLADVAVFNRLNEEARAVGLEELFALAASWDSTGQRLVSLFDRVWYRGVMKEAFDARPALLRFERIDHEKTIEDFRRLDEALLLRNRAKVLLCHWETAYQTRPPAPGSLGLLQMELAKKRHRPIRETMSHAGDAVQAIKPVFMMSPLSVAACLPPDGPAFDVVIFDEASQVKPADACGAIARGSQLIVVGDSKQLPPTAFFDRLIQSEDTEGMTSDVESILGLVDSRILPNSQRRRYLRWHYRSRHDSLISVSNHLFYRHKPLVIFPNPVRKDAEIGLFYHYLPHGFYDRGISRKNVVEAQEVVRAAVRHVRQHPDLSLGIAAFSGQQQEAIQDEFDRIEQGVPELHAFDRAHETEPLFIKNLENVQGDERDVILISVGYGFDRDGYVAMNFGPINNDGGERRLNVLITRAKYRCDVFTNLHSSDIRIDPATKLGVRALRTFLHFAESGEMDEPTPSDKEPQSEFEIAVIEALERRGHKIVPQVGSAGFFVDIGVCDRDNPNRFVLGIECDGAKYHSSRSARERDRLREQVLIERGWRIHRVWSTDWYRNQDRELRRALEAIEKAQEAVPRNAVRSSNDHGPVSISRDPADTGLAGDLSRAYQCARPTVSLGGQELRNVVPQRVAVWVAEVVGVESPVHIQEVTERIRVAAGMSRTGHAACDAVESGARSAARQGTVCIKGDFLWRKPEHAPAVRDRSALPSCSRKIGLVAPEEIIAAISLLVDRSFGITAAELAVETPKLLGIRPSDESRNIVNGLTGDLMKHGRLHERNGKLVCSTEDGR